MSIKSTTEIETDKNTENEIHCTCRKPTVGGTCCTCGKPIDYGKMYCEDCRPK